MILCTFIIALSISWGFQLVVGGLNPSMCVQLLPLLKIASPNLEQQPARPVVNWPCLLGYPLVTLYKVVSKPSVQSPHSPRITPLFFILQLSLWSHLHVSFLLGYSTVYQPLSQSAWFWLLILFYSPLPPPPLTWPHPILPSPLPWRTSSSSHHPSIVFASPGIHPASDLIMSLFFRKLSKESLSCTM